MSRLSVPSKIAKFTAIHDNQITALIITFRHIGLVLRKSKTMRRLSTLLFIGAILSGTADLARAEVCGDITRDLRQAAQLAHRPTPESVGQAQTYRELIFAAELAHAEAEDVLGHEGDCLLATRRAKEMLQIGANARRRPG